MSPSESPNLEAPDPHVQMLKLVAKGFYKELINYGVKEPEILSVAGHLLDNVVLKSPPESKRDRAYDKLFTVKDVNDEWAAHQRLNLHEVSLVPLQSDQVPQIAAWLKVPRVRNSFFPRFPESGAALARHFQSPEREYFSICYQDQFVGIIGADYIDPVSSKLEMRKLVGDSSMRGKGIGKRATFLFLYHVFVIRQTFKVYLHTLDINIRNLNLNGNFGFWLEGVFFEDALVDEERLDVVRMALTEPVWRGIFGNSPHL